MAEISALGYVGFGVSDLAAWETFAVEILGMMVRQRADGSLALRMDEYQQRFFIEQSDKDDILVAGWEFLTAADLSSYVSELSDQGVAVSELSAAQCASRCVEQAYSVADPNGFAHEFFFGHQVARLDDAFRSTVLKSGFVTGDLGVGHILPFTTRGAETIHFYKNVLKLRVSDYIREEVAPGMLVDAIFFHTATGRHHSIATAEVPHVSKTLNHFMIQVADMDDVGLAYERAVKAGIPVALELGHHPNDKMFSFYARTPSGFNFEFGWGGVVIDDASWEVKSYSQLSDWGHHRNNLD
tara:strand:- start:3208 stop:4101 length:894 start_codon:yes stop_codon:yes gene_type:complete